MNLSKLLYYVKSGRIDPSKQINIRTLYRVGAVSKARFGVKILSRVNFSSTQQSGLMIFKTSKKGIEEIDVPLHIEVSDASKRAIYIIKKVIG